MDSTKLKAIIIAVLATFVALFLGLNAATAQLQTVMWVTGVSTLIICAMLGTRIWIIIPFSMAMNMSLQLPGQPSTLLIAQALFSGFCCLLFLIRKLPVKFKFTELEFWILLLTLCILQVYIRNPVSLNIIGGESVGAKPYAIFCASLVTFIFLSNMQIPTIDLKWLLRIHIVGGLINFALMTAGYFIPRLGVWYGSADMKSLSGSVFQEGSYGDTRANRVGFVRGISNNLALWISAYKSPIKACFHPIWAPLVLLSFAFAALSGYRNEIGAVGLTYLVAIAYRGGFRSIIIATMTFIVGLIFLALFNLASPLPANIQRSLSFLPGTWDEYHKSDAKHSTEWRVEMWEEALLTDFWIKNKWLGDGLGLTRMELNFIRSLEGQNINTPTSRGGLSLQQQSMMATGDYHSGPVSTIRTIGYLGLIVLLLAQIRLAMHAHRQIMRAKNTEWFPLTLLIGIPLIFHPVFYVFVVGSFANSSVVLLLGTAMVRILENNLPKSISATRPEKQAQVPLPHQGA